jgi:pimeloyl-ACP methyl ester carboxylesterase
MLPLATWFAHTTGATAVLWEYRGFGASGGSLDVAKTRGDALLLYDDVRRRSGSIPWVYGVSYGTTVAAAIARARPVRGVILHAPPSDAMTECLYVRDRYLPWPFHRLRPAPSAAVAAAFAVATTMHGVHAPLIVLHGTADTLIPIAEGRAVERAAGSREKRFVAIPHATHADVRYEGTPAGAAIAAFMLGR